MNEPTSKRIELIVEFEIRVEEEAPIDAPIDDILFEIEAVVRDICPQAYNIFSEELE